MRKQLFLLITGLAIVSSTTCLAKITEEPSLRDKDTTTVKASKYNTGLFLNAEADEKTREISLGLPTNAAGSVQVFEDGLPVSYTTAIYHYKSWHGGTSASYTGSVGPMETAMRMGDIAYYANSLNKVGSDKRSSTIKYSLNQYIQNKIDANITGPLGKGWGYSLNAFLNFDRGSNHLSVYPFRDRHQFYKGAISKLFAENKGEVSLVYQYVNYMSIKENVGPFVFVGDGSVKEIDGFHLGTDNYYVSDRDFTFMNFKTGKMTTLDYIKGNTDNSHHVTLNFSYLLRENIKFTFHSRFKSAESSRTSMNISGIETVTADNKYQYADGTTFTGMIQRRNLLHFDVSEHSWFNTAILEGISNRHKWQAGLDLWFNSTGNVTSSGSTAHELKNDPKRLYRNGVAFYNFNTSGEYYDGNDHKIAAFVSDEFKGWKGLNVKAFLRVEHQGLDGESANNIGDDTSNSRISDFNLTKGKITPFSRSYLNGGLGLKLDQKLGNGFNLIAEYTAVRKHNHLLNFAGYQVPNDNASDTWLLRGGLSYRNSWLNVVSQVLYISQNNMQTHNSFQHSLEKEVGDLPLGYTETVDLPIIYGITSLGWTTDAVFSPFKGFRVNIALTLRDPQYKKFVFNPTFSDGVSHTYDFSGKNVTNLHKTEVSVSPAYTINKWNFYLTARYISKQYINKTNSLYFNERIETFGGVNYTMNRNVKFTLNIINLLNQKGASGSISSADLVEDTSNYHNYIMAGTFIRPFTVEMGVTMNL